MSAALAAASYTPGDLSRLLAPSAGAPVIVSKTAAADPSFFGYLRPTKGRKPSRKSAKGGGKFSKETLAKKAKAKKAEANTQRDRHEKEVADAAARKLAEKAARLNKNGSKAKAASAAPAADDGEEDSGMDDSDGDEGDEIDEAAIEDFMADIEAEDGGAGEASSEEEVDEAELDPLAKAKKERLAKRDKRLAEDKEAETPRQSKKDIKKQRKENLENDPRLPRTIFVGNVPSLLKSAKLSSWIEKQLGVDSSTTQSIIESVRYRSVAISDPKLPKKVAIQKGLLHEARDSLNAYVVFTEEKPWVARAIAELNGKEIELDEKSWRLRFDTVTSGANAEAKPVRDNALTLFVGNLPFNINENDLYGHFGGCGPITNVRVVRDRESNMGKGIAFITFGDAQSLRNGLAFNHTKFVNRELRIMKAVENKKLHHTDGGKTSSSKKPTSASAASAAAASASGKKSGAAGRKEGYGGAHKIKEVNQAGVLKKPRHTPRDGSAPTVQPKAPASAMVANSSAAAAASTAVSPAAAAAAAARPISASRIQGAKRSFEGEHADPSAHIKKQKVEEVKQREKKQLKRDNKKLAPAAGSKKKE